MGLKGHGNYNRKKIQCLSQTFKDLSIFVGTELVFFINTMQTSKLNSWGTIKFSGKGVVQGMAFEIKDEWYFSLSFLDSCWGIWQLVGQVPVVRLGVPLKCKACKLGDPLSYPFDKYKLNLYIIFYVLTCIATFQYLSIPCNAFFACYYYVTWYLIGINQGLITPLQ